MRQEKKEIIKLTSAKLLLTMFEVIEATAKPFFKASSVYRRSISEYNKNSKFDKTEINERIQYLKRIGFIKTFVENKEKFVELLPSGIKKLRLLSEENLFSKPSEWDKKWRVVIFDVPEKFRSARDSLRFKLQTFGFAKIQKSVYVYPFTCTDEISALTNRLEIGKYVTIMIAEIIQGEENIIDEFLQNGLLTKNQLKNKS